MFTSAPNGILVRLCAGLPDNGMACADKAPYLPDPAGLFAAELVVAQRTWLDRGGRPR